MAIKPGDRVKIRPAYSDTPAPTVTGTVVNVNDLNSPFPIWIALDDGDDGEPAVPYAVCEVIAAED